MKKILFFLFLASSMFAFGQNSAALKDIQTIQFYGVDYSMARVFGAAESPTQFKNIFPEINDLFITQAKKFDIGKFTGKQVEAISLEAVNKVNGKINTHDIETTSPNYTLDAAQITEAVQRLPIANGTGTGVVLVAKLLSKADNNGSYQLVYFNIATKEIIDSFPLNGKARGFGLRNFWAGSVYNALKKID